MDTYFNTPLDNLSDDDLKRIINSCQLEITRRENEHYDNLYENVIKSLTEMVKYFPYRFSMTCPECDKEFDWDDILKRLKNYHE